MSKKIFKEEQRFRAYDLVALLISVMLALMIILIREFHRLNEYGYAILFATLAVIGSLAYAIYYLFTLELKTTISDKSISFKIKNWHTKQHNIDLEQIEDCSLVKTPFITQLHGANIPCHNEQFYSFSGRNGVSLTTKDGHHYFIGSRRLNELEQALRNITQTKN